MVCYFVVWWKKVFLIVIVWCRLGCVGLVMRLKILIGVVNRVFVW